MDDAERRTAKRSRFDQTEPEPRRSRFDRRSRSPPARKPDSDRDRERSPLSRPRDTPADSKSPPVDPAAAAAAAAARINAQIQARKGIQHVDVPPMRSSSVATSGGSTPRPNPGSTINGEMYISDGDYIKDIEVNDLRNRYLLTKGATQKMIKEETGADVTTRGSYYPDKSLATPSNPPLYLHVTSTTKEGLEKAVAKIEELMKQELPQLVDERRFRRREQEQQPVERDEFGRRKWPEEKIPIGLDPVPGFNLRAQVVGHGGAYVKHIQQETGCRVQIKGRGSGYMEVSTGRESDEPMFLHVAGPDPNMVAKAKELCEDLLANVREQYEEFKNRPPRGYGGGYGGGRGGDSYHPHNRDNHYQGGGSSHSYSNSPAPGANASVSPPPAAASTTATPTSAADYAAQYAQYYGTDPYAAYGGYQAYVQMYQQWVAAQQAQGGQQAGAPGASGATPSAAPGAPGAQSAAAPPPPPPSEAAPPPPPPPSAAPPPPPPGPPGSSGYNAHYPSSHDAVKEPHSVSLKVLRLSRPSLVAQYPLQLPLAPADDPISHPPPNPASLAYQTTTTGPSDDGATTNTSPFLLTPILNLPPSFGSAYVGETFSCTLCANHDVPEGAAAATGGGGGGGGGAKTIRDVRIEAEMKTPSTGNTRPPIKLTLLPLSSSSSSSTTTTTTSTSTTDSTTATTTTTITGHDSAPAEPGADLAPGTSLQKILAFDLKESGTHVLCVTVSYYEASALSGRTRTFRKLYQFVSKPSLIVRTKPGVLPPRRKRRGRTKGDDGDGEGKGAGLVRRWVLEAQLENCGEDAVLLERVGLAVEEGLVWEGGNLDGLGGEDGNMASGKQKEPPPLLASSGVGARRRPVLQPGETEQVCFVIEEAEPGAAPEVDGRVVFGVLEIGWRSEMGNRGFLATGKLGTRLAAAVGR
ncbi:hypothetical protein VTJ49DRAFT_3464 [Mycothermus thermophilus]|uniref:K Homology domain-containing protein n=1 Tax=Humicola insolens TaxID=85995 RepID=A0ABR3VMX7_HUMIN